MKISASVTFPAKRLATVLLGGLCLILSSFLSHAQLPGGQSSFNPALLQLFSVHKAFSGKTDLRMLDGAQKPIMSMPMDMLFLDGKVRAELNVGQISGQNAGQEALAMFKQAGMDQVASILRPDRKKAIISFANAKVFVEDSLTAEDAASFTTKFNVQTTEIGKETVAGQSCIKSKVVFTAPGGSKLEGMVWNAPALKNFPVKIVIPEGGSTLELTFREVKLEKPNASAFEAPAGFTRYESMEKLVQERLAKALGVQPK